MTVTKEKNSRKKPAKTSSTPPSDTKSTKENSKVHNFPIQDARKLARQENTNHFTNRAPKDKQ